MSNGDGYNYPDSLYAAHLAKQTPAGAYRAPEPIDPIESKVIKAMEQTAAASELLASVLAMLRDKRYIALESAQAPAHDDPVNDPSQYVPTAYCPKRAKPYYEAPIGWCEHVTPAAFLDPAAELKRAGIGDVAHEPRHVMAAEADRMATPGDRL